MHSAMPHSTAAPMAALEMIQDLSDGLRMPG